MRQIFDSSDKAMQADARSRKKYPWEELGVGQSFAATPDEITLDSLRPLASRMGKKLGRRFRVINHEDKSYEVARLPDPVLTAEELVKQGVTPWSAGVPLKQEQE